MELIAKSDYAYDWIGSVGSVFYFRTTNAASRGRVISIDIAHPEPRLWREIVAQQEESIDSVRFAYGKFLISYLRDAHSQSELYTSDGELIREIELPGIGTATWSPVQPEDREIVYSFSSFTSPNTLYRYDLATENSTLFRGGKLNFDPGDFETKQIFYASKDGTRVRMFLVYKKGLQVDGCNPTLLYGYGGFNVALTPSFSASIFAWMEMGGI